MEFVIRFLGRFVPSTPTLFLLVAALAASAGAWAGVRWESANTERVRVEAAREALEAAEAAHARDLAERDAVIARLEESNSAAARIAAASAREADNWKRQAERVREIRRDITEIFREEERSAPAACKCSLSRADRERLQRIIVVPPRPPAAPAPDSAAGQPSGEPLP